MGQLDLKFYLSIFLRRLPYFLVIAAFVSAIGIAVASILPASYSSTRHDPRRGPQIPDDLARSTVPVNPVEQIQIIERRLMTRANLLSLADQLRHLCRPARHLGRRHRRGHAGPHLARRLGAGRRGSPGATTIEVAFSSPDPRQAADVTNELVTLILQENVSLRTGRAEDTLAFFEGEVERLSGELDRLSQKIMEFKSANENALPDSLAFRRNQQATLQERLLQLEREETALQDDRERTVEIYEQTGRLAQRPPRNPRGAGPRGAAPPARPGAGDLFADQPEHPAARDPDRRAREDRRRAARRARRRPGHVGARHPARRDRRPAEVQSPTSGRASRPSSPGSTPRSRRRRPTSWRWAGSSATTPTCRRSTTPPPSAGHAAIGERLEVTSKGERFSLVEPAVAPTAPDEPNRVLIAGAGVAGGLGAGLGFIVLLELLNRSIRRPSELSAQLGIQPFATIPYIRTGRELRWKRTLILVCWR